MSHPSPLLPLRGRPLKLFDTAALRRLERAAGAHSPLMEHAGLGIARLARALWPKAQRISLLCGPGNNGGDGFVAARWLQEQGLTVQLIAVGDAKAPSPERLRVEKAAQAAGLRISSLADLDGNADLLIDALLGLGLRAAPEGALAVAIDAMNRHPAPKLGVDLPSGLMADTGAAPGAVVRCTHTLSLLAPTPGLFTGEGRQQAGGLWLDRLGCTPNEAPCTLAGSSLEPWHRHSARAQWPHGAHKGTAGQVYVLQGAPQMAGAARLAARAALAAGAGRVYLTGEGSTVDTDPLWPELMHPTLDQSLDALTTGVGVAGCGGARQVAELLPPWLERAQQLVLDADALNALAASPALQQQLMERSAHGQRSVLTPHPLEAARLLGLNDTVQIQRNRLGAAQQLAERFGCTVVLKGSGCVIADPSTLPHINSSGHAALGTAGTGDVLAGWLAGLMAQAKTSPLHELAALACAWQGEAADLVPAGSGPLRASKLIDAMATLQP